MKSLKIALFSILLLSPLLLLAQDSTDAKAKTKDFITNRFAAARFIDFEYEYLSPTNFTSKIHSQDYEKGKINSTNRARLSLNYPLYKTTKLAIIPLLRYRFESLNFSDIEKQPIDVSEIYHRKGEEFHYIMAAVNTTYFSTLLGKRTIYSFNLSVDGSNKGYEHVAATGVAVMVLKKDERKTVTVGLAASLDRAALFPFFPLFSYEYKFINTGWSFDTYLPRYVYLRKLLSTNRRLSLGTQLNSEAFYTHPQSEKLDASYSMTRKEIRTGFVYEHYIDKHFIVTARGGMVNTIGWKITKKKSRKAIINYSPDMNVYFNIGFSYNL